MKRVARFTKLMVKHPGIPRPLRWALGLAALPVPGPFDELVGVAVIGILMVIRPGLISTTWREAA